MIVLQLIQIEQTLLALPWVLTMALLAFKQGFLLTPLLIAKMVLATFFARIAGMSFNRFFDKELDLQNPRTKNRLLPAKKISAQFVFYFGVVALLLFLATCFLINSLCFSLSFVVAFLLILYPFTKRFTQYCHFVLGSIEFFAPLMAFVAISGFISFESLLLSSIVFLWVSGLDLLYAMQDISFDKVFSVYSMTAHLGARKARKLSLSLHSIAIFLMFAVGFLFKMHILYYLGSFLAAFFLFYQYRFIKATEQKITKSFFILNILMSVTYFVFTFGDVVLWK